MTSINTLRKINMSSPSVEIGHPIPLAIVPNKNIARLYGGAAKGLTKNDKT
jgi:hypothetical protein